MTGSLFKMFKDDKQLVIYRPKLSQVLGTTSAILLAQIIYWWNDKPFYKYKEPCDASDYRGGDSWCEELGFSRREFDTALKHIATKIKNGDKIGNVPTTIPDRDPDETQDNHIKRIREVLQSLVFYWTDRDRKTWYTVNAALLDHLLKLLYSDLAKVRFALYMVKRDSYFTYKEYTETTSETTKDSPLASDEQKQPLASGDGQTVDECVYGGVTEDNHTWVYIEKDGLMGEACMRCGVWNLEKPPRAILANGDGQTPEAPNVAVRNIPDSQRHIVKRTDNSMFAVISKPRATLPSLEKQVLCEAARRGYTQNRSEKVVSNADEFNAAIATQVSRGLLQTTRRVGRYALTEAGKNYVREHWPEAFTSDDTVPVPPICTNGKQAKAATTDDKLVKITTDNQPYAAIIAPTFWYSTPEAILDPSARKNLNRICTALRQGGHTTEQVAAVCGEVEAMRARERDNKSHWVHTFTANGLAAGNGRFAQLLHAGNGSSKKVSYIVVE